MQAPAVPTSAADADLVVGDRHTNDFLNLAAERDPLAPVNLRQLVAEVLASLARQLSAHAIRTTLDVADHHVALADRDVLGRIVLNLALNALDAMPAGGELVVTSHSGFGGIELEIADTGPGLSHDVLRRAFKPFFTSQSSGSGLGLASVYRLAEALGGQVLAANCPEGGAAFTICLRNAHGTRAPKSTCSGEANSDVIDATK